MRSRPNRRGGCSTARRSDWACLPPVGSPVGSAATSTSSPGSGTAWPGPACRPIWTPGSSSRPSIASWLVCAATRSGAATTSSSSFPGRSGSVCRSRCRLPNYEVFCDLCPRFDTIFLSEAPMSRIAPVFTLFSLSVAALASTATTACTGDGYESIVVIQNQIAESGCRVGTSTSTFVRAGSSRQRPATRARRTSCTRSSATSRPPKVAPRSVSAPPS